MGFEGGRGDRCERRVVALLDASGTGGGAQASVVRDVTSVMDVGIILGRSWRRGWRGVSPDMARAGALARRGGGRRVVPRLRRAHRVRLQHRRVLQRIASASVHGWLWLVPHSRELRRTWLRPLFGLRVERTRAA